MSKAAARHNYASSCNACRQCTPLGACLVFAGIRGAVPYLHGSQGCATYIRRYLISHFREPMDIASSSFSEESAIFGGERNFQVGLENVRRQYEPEMIGVATTCLSETIGDDVPAFLKTLRRTWGDLPVVPEVIHVSTPSYTGSHEDGYHDAARAVVAGLAAPTVETPAVGVFPGLVSCEDLRALRAMLEAYDLRGVILPDYSDSLDGPAWDEYHEIPPGGTSVAEIRGLGGAAAVIDLSACVPDKQLPGAWLADQRGRTRYKLPLPIGIAQTDRWHELLKTVSGRNTPAGVLRARGRLVDAYVDGHKYVSGQTAVVYGESDLAAGLAGFLTEIGMDVLLCATGGKNGGLAGGLRQVAPEAGGIEVREGVDFRDLEAEIESMKPDLLVGHSKGFKTARALGIPLIRVGFPIHDRFGGSRVEHLGYRGAQLLFDRIVNAIIEHRQAASPVGYTYM